MGRIRLQYYGYCDAIPAKDLKPGTVTVWNGGAKDTVKSVTFSKTGKTLTVTFQDDGTRKFSADRLVAVEIPETKQPFNPARYVAAQIVKNGIIGNMAVTVIKSTCPDGTDAAAWEKAVRHEQRVLLRVE